MADEISPRKKISEHIEFFKSHTAANYLKFSEKFYEMNLPYKFLVFFSSKNIHLNGYKHLEYRLDITKKN